MDLSIIILNYKTKNFLRTCLRGVQMFNHGLEYEIIVVDNFSNDGSVDMVKKEFPKVRLIASQKNLGHAGGNNLGLTKARGKYILLLNTDIALLGGSVDQLYNFMEQNIDVGLAGACLLNPDKSIQNSCLRFPDLMIPVYRRTFLGKFKKVKQRLHHYTMEDFDHKTNREVDWVISSAIMARKKAIDKVGLMDDDFFVYFADVDWCRRFWENNYKVFYVADASMIHYHRRESAESKGFSSIVSPLTRIHIKDWITYLKKYNQKNNF